MPRNKTRAELDAMPRKNQQTQCHFGIKFGGKQDFGVQVCVESQKKVSGQGLEKIEKRTQTTGKATGECKFCDSKSNKIYLNSETQTEVFGFTISPSKWEEINQFSKPRKRKLLVDKQTSANECDFQAKRPALEIMDKIPTTVENATLDLPSNLHFPLAISTVKSFIEAQNQVGISIRLLKGNDSLLDFLEVSLEKRLYKMTASFYETPTRLLFSSDGNLLIVTLFKPAVTKKFFDFEEGNLNSDIVKNALGILSEKYVFCPGIPREDCTGLENTKNLEKIAYPFERFQSLECLTWFIPPSNASKEKIEGKIYQCKNCRALKSYIRDCQKKKAQVTPRTKLKRQSVESRCRISVLTAKSKCKRILKNKRKRSALNQKIKRLETKLVETSLELGDVQSNQMREVVAEINLNNQDPLQDIFKQATKKKKKKIMGLALKKAWKANSATSPL